MGERKVLNKYYPSDFDPAKIPRRRQPKNKQIEVRMMLPMSVRCTTCGNFIYQGTKFNSRKEIVHGESYFGIQVFRFYFKCTNCSAELSIKTDPRNSDYVVDAGVTRNFEPWRVQDEVVKNEKRKRDAEELGDAIKSLENKTLDSKREIDIMAALDEIKSMKSRHASVSQEEMLEALQRSHQGQDLHEKLLDGEDEALVKSIFHGPKQNVRRINDEDWDDDSLKKSKLSAGVIKPADVLTKSCPLADLSDTEPSNSKKPIDGPPKVSFMVKRKATQKPDNLELVKNEDFEQRANIVTSSGLISLCHYGDSEDDEQEQQEH